VVVLLTRFRIKSYLDKRKMYMYTIRIECVIKNRTEQIKQVYILVNNTISNL